MTLMNELSLESHGVFSVELTPQFSSPSIVTQLRRTFERASAARLAIAYWCTEAEIASKTLNVPLGDEGFLCTDVHLPTDIDILSRLHAGGANVLLHLRHPAPGPGGLRGQLPPHLLHTKVMLFDLADDMAELWVGSHNWTARALTGVNIEASLVLRLNRSGTMYASAIALLDAIRSQCEPFDANRVDYYKWLQEKSIGETVWVMEVRAEDPDALAGRRITIFLSTEDQYKYLKKVDKDLVLSAEGTTSRSDLLYEATIADSGHLKDAGVSFDRRLYACHRGSGLPRIVGPSIPSTSELEGMRFWASVDIRTLLPPEREAVELPPAQRWIRAPNDALASRVTRSDDPRRTKGTTPVIYHPMPFEEFSRQIAGPARGRADLAPDADSHRDTPAQMEGGRPIVRKMILR